MIHDRNAYIRYRVLTRLYLFLRMLIIKMAPSAFTIFGKLPVELRAYVWKIAILGHSKNRLVPLDRPWSNEFRASLRITLTKCLVPSPISFANSESKMAADRLYPVVVPIRGTAKFSYSAYPVPRGNQKVTEHNILRISFENDIFVLYDTLALQDILYENKARAQDRVDVFPGWYYTAQRLSQGQCAQIQHIMELDIRALTNLSAAYSVYGHSSGEHDSLEYALRHAMSRVRHSYNKSVFPGVRTCHHVWCDSDDSRQLLRDSLNHSTQEEDLVQDIISLPASQVLDKWAKHMLYCSEEEMKRKAVLDLEG